MGIYIRGMKKPRSCFGCPMYFLGRCRLVGRNIPDLANGKTPDFCRIVEVKPHGRLIDAESFVDYMQNRYINNELTNGDWIDFRMSLKEQPTIIKAEGSVESG